MFDITSLVNSLLGLCAAVITAYVIPWIKSKTTENQRKHIMNIVKMLVSAAEQLAENNGWEGKQKLIYVKQQLEKRGIGIDLEAIEAMVYELRFQEREIGVDDIKLEVTGEIGTAKE